MRTTSRRSRQGGQAMVEFALLLPFLVMMVGGLIEYGRALDEKHSISTLTRESALLAARGTSLDSTTQSVIDNGADIRLSTNGGVIASEVQIVSATEARVRSQNRKPSTGFSTASRIGTVGNRAPALENIGLLPGSYVYVVEVFYTHRPLVSLGKLVRVLVPTTLYERAVF